jgi:DUF1680 family protein
VNQQRQKWFGCACCPPNLARTITSLANYIYTKKDDTLFVHLYIGNETSTLINGIQTKISMTTDYPWNEDITIDVTPEETVEGTLAFRIPGWCRDYSVSKNGKEIALNDTNFRDGYFYLKSSWSEGDIIRLHFAMPVQVVRSNPMVRENIGKVAILRGPIVYCLEQEDNGPFLQRVRLPKSPIFTIEYNKSLLGCIVKLSSNGTILTDEGWEKGSLYDFCTEETFTEKELTWIPYYAWANRSSGEMLVWVKSE